MNRKRQGEKKRRDSEGVKGEKGAKWREGKSLSGDEEDKKGGRKSGKRTGGKKNEGERNAK